MGLGVTREEGAFRVWVEEKNPPGRGVGTVRRRGVYSRRRRRAVRRRGPPYLVPGGTNKMMNKKRRFQTTLRLSHVHYSSREREPRPDDDAAVRPRGRSPRLARGPVPRRINPPGVEMREGAATARDACVTSPAPPRPSQSMTMGSWGSWAGRGVHPPGARRRGSGASSDGARASLLPTEEPNGGGGRADHPPPRGEMG